MEYLQRRDILLRGGAAASILVLNSHGLVAAVQEKDHVIPWSDQPPPVPPPAQGAVKYLTPWESLDSWITPNDKFFEVAHYEWPNLDPAKWRLDVLGHIATPVSYT